MRRVTLGEHSDLLLDVLNLIVCFLQINDLDCHYLVAAVLHPLEDLSKVPLADPLLLGVKPLRVCLSLSNRGGELGGGQEGMASLKGSLHNTGNSC